MIVMTGATGFVGGVLARKLVKEGFSLRCIARDPIKAKGLEAIGIELVKGDITDRDSLIKAVEGAEKAISLVGILFESGRATFKAIHAEGVRNYLEACKKKGVKDFIHISALGAREDAKSEYHRTKWEAEEFIRNSQLNYAIFRPSVIFGKEDKFTNLFARIIRLSPAINIPGSGKNRMQPVYVKDLVKAMVMTVKNPGFMGKTYEIGGRDCLTFEEIMDAICKVLEKKRIKLHIPIPLLRPGAFLMEMLLSRPLLTRDQLIMLQEDNITERNALKEVFGIEPIGFEEGMRGYLSGQ